MLGFVRARFDFHRQNEAGVRRERGASPGATLERLRAVARRRSTPPGPLDSRLVEEVVHGEDVRRPLGRSRDYPPEAVDRALRLQAGTSRRFGGARELLTIVQVCPAGTNLSFGDGPEVSGPALSLLLALSGRRVALSDLDGPGLGRLADSL